MSDLYLQVPIVMLSNRNIMRVTYVIKIFLVASLKIFKKMKLILISFL